MSEKQPKTNLKNWFSYPVIAQPNHTDYSGIVWHGNYIAWMEEARVEYLRSVGVNFADLVAQGCDLPVVELDIRYHQSIKMGDRAVVKTYMHPVSGVRLNWDYLIESPDAKKLFVTAKVTLVTVDRNKGKIMRKFSPEVKDILAKLVGN